MMAELNGAPAANAALQALGLVNYGHFTSMKVDERSIRGFSKHLDRLVRDCRELFGCELDRRRVRELVCQAVEATEGPAIVRVTVFDPDLELGHPGKSSNQPGVLVTVRSAPTVPAQPIRVRTVIYSRDLQLVKHVGIFGAISHRRAAQRAGFDDALFTDVASYIQEGASWNVGFFDGASVVWPKARVLPGVTMTLLKQVHDNSVIKPVNTRDLGQMVAAFATNTAVGVRPISAIDDMEFDSGHPIIAILQKEYEEIPAERLSGAEI